MPLLAQPNSEPTLLFTHPAKPCLGAFASGLGFGRTSGFGAGFGFLLASGSILVSALISGGVGVAPSWGKIGLTTHVSGTLPVANGGTGATSSASALDALLPSGQISGYVLATGGSNGTISITPVA